MQKLGKLAEQLGLGSTWAVEACTRLGGMADSLVQATLELTAELQAKLFAGDALSVSLGTSHADMHWLINSALQSGWLCTCMLHAAWQCQLAILAWTNLHLMHV